jgi:hypothetical protein
MTRPVRFVVGAIVVVHGLIHLMGVAKGFGWASIDELSEPISTVAAWAWLAAALSVVVAGSWLMSPHRQWWPLSLGAAVCSQLVIMTSWSDAKAGTAINLLLLIAGVGELAESKHGLTSGYPRHRSA